MGEGFFKFVNHKGVRLANERDGQQRGSVESGHTGQHSTIKPHTNWKIHTLRLVSDWASTEHILWPNSGKDSFTIIWPQCHLHLYGVLSCMDAYCKDQHI